MKLGSVDQLEGDGDGENFRALGAYIKAIFPRVTEVERFGRRVTYMIPQGGFKSLSRTFNALEEGTHILLSSELFGSLPCNLFIHLVQANNAKIGVVWEKFGT